MFIMYKNEILCKYVINMWCSHRNTRVSSLNHGQMCSHHPLSVPTTQVQNKNGWSPCRQTETPGSVWCWIRSGGDATSDWYPGKDRGAECWALMRRAAQTIVPSYESYPHSGKAPPTKHWLVGLCPPQNKKHEWSEAKPNLSQMSRFVLLVLNRMYFKRSIRVIYF